MRDEHKELAERIQNVLRSNNLVPKTKKAREAEVFMLIGYLLAQENPSPYLTILVGSGRLLTEEYKKLED